jgi:uncharacterized membrane protein HdeD (DUF308 family)
VNQFLLGAIAALSIVAGIVFVRSWRQTRDRLFLFFGLAFLIEGLNRAALALTADPREGDPFFYLVRAGTFLLILYAIWEKNRHADAVDTG